MGGGPNLQQLHMSGLGTVNDLPVAGGTPGIAVGGSAFAARIIGPGRMTEMMLTGRRVDAEEGQNIGLSHHLSMKPSTRRWNWHRPLR